MLIAFYRAQIEIDIVFSRMWGSALLQPGTMYVAHFLCVRASESMEGEERIQQYYKIELSWRQVNSVDMRYLAKDTKL